jgi:hypothetical protein
LNLTLRKAKTEKKGKKGGGNGHQTSNNINTSFLSGHGLIKSSVFDKIAMAKA